MLLPVIAEFTYCLKYYVVVKTWFTQRVECIYFGLWANSQNAFWVFYYSFNHNSVCILIDNLTLQKNVFLYNAVVKQFCNAK